MGNSMDQSNSTVQSTTLGAQKANICFLCQREYSKISCHLKTHINEDAEVAQAFSLPEGSRQRKKLLEKLRNRGNLKLKNNEVLKTHGDSLNVKSSAHGTDKKYNYCIHCKGMYLQTRLRNHMEKCPSKPKETEHQGRQPELSLESVVTSACSNAVSENGLLKILGHMHDDDIARALSSDFCLDRFSKSLYSLHGHDPAKHDYIRQKILDLGRFLLTMRKTSSILTLGDAVKPGNFLNVVKVVKEITGFDATEESAEITSLALRIGQSLFEVSDIVQCQAVLTGDEDLIKSTTEFKKLYQAKWSEYISHSALSTASDLKDNNPTKLPPTEDIGGLNTHLDKKAESATAALEDQTSAQNCSSLARQQTHQTTNKPIELPSIEDIGKLYTHLDKKAEAATTALKEQATAQNYSSLARTTLTKIILLNRRRVGKVSKMKLRNFLERECPNKLEVGLSEYEQKLCRYFLRVGLKGKAGREVAVLLTPEMVNALNLIIGKRQKCGVPDENEYLFAIPEYLTYFSGHQSLILFADECGAKISDYFQSAQMRKEVAIASQILSFRDNELDQLSKFLGQEIPVQRRLCWQSEPTEQRAKISKLLLALEKGKLHELQGKSLDDVGGTYVLTGFDAQCCTFVALPLKLIVLMERLLECQLLYRHFPSLGL